MNDKRESKKSVLAAWHDDDDVYLYLPKQGYLFKNEYDSITGVWTQLLGCCRAKH